MLTTEAGLGGDDVRRQWQILADALHVQRLHLHLPEWRETVEGGGPLPDVTPAVTGAHLSGRPNGAGTLSDALVTAAGLADWSAVATTHGLDQPLAGPLASVASDLAARVIGDLPGNDVRRAGAVVTEAAAWWVGFFTVVRHRGLHHRELTPVQDTIELATLERAARAVALGALTRVLGAHVRASDDDKTRAAYCRAVAEGVVTEAEMPELVESMGELRLADLVTMSVPWRGQFTKFAGGTGAGQVE